MFIIMLIVLIIGRRVVVVVPSFRRFPWEITVTFVYYCTDEYVIVS